MTESYKKTLLRLSTAQICSSIGYNSTHNSSIEILQDILNKFLTEFSRDLKHHVEHYNRREPNVKDLFLTIGNLKLNIKSLKEYIDNVEQSPFCVNVPKFPLFKVPNMKFPKKPVDEQSEERPSYVFEYLPPMLTCQEEADAGSKDTTAKDTSDEHSMNIVPSNNVIFDGNVQYQKQKLRQEEESFPNSSLVNKGVKSAFMTSTGDISPMVQGKTAEMLMPALFDKLKDVDDPLENIEKVNEKPLVVTDKKKNQSSNEGAPHSSKKNTTDINKTSKEVVDKPAENIHESNSFPKKKPLSTNNAVFTPEEVKSNSTPKTEMDEPLPAPFESEKSKNTSKTSLGKMLRKQEKIKQKKMKQRDKNNLPLTLSLVSNHKNHAEPSHMKKEPFVNVNLEKSDTDSKVLGQKNAVDLDKVVNNNLLETSSKFDEEIPKKKHIEGNNIKMDDNAWKVNTFDNNRLGNVSADYDLKIVEPFKTPSVVETDINLPSGTTITPSNFLPPPLSTNETNIMSNPMFDINSMNTLPPATEVVKKKRGRKPGSKNAPRNIPTELLSIPPPANFMLPDTSQIMISPPKISKNLGNQNIQHMQSLESVIPSSEKKKKRQKKNVGNLKEFAFVNDGITGIERSKHRLNNEQNIESSSMPNTDNNSNMKFCMDSAFSASGLLQAGLMLDNSCLQNTFKTPEQNSLPVFPMFSFPPAPGLIPSTNLMFPPDFTKQNIPSKASDYLHFPKVKEGSHSIFERNNLPGDVNVDLEQMPQSSDGSFCNVAPLLPDFTPFNSHLKKGSNSMLFNSKKEATFTHKKKTSSKNLMAKQSEYPDLFNRFYGDQSTILSQKNKSLQLPEQSKLLPNNFFHANNRLSNQTSLLLDKPPKNINQAFPETIEVSDDSNDANLNLQNQVVKNFDDVSGNERKFDVPKSNPKLLQDETDIANVRKNQFYQKPIMLSSNSNSKNLNDFYDMECGGSFKKLAGGADLIPLTGSSTGLAYSSKSIPPTSLTGISFGDNDLSSMKDPSVINLDSVMVSPSAKISAVGSPKRKDLKKNKKMKEGKVKKKKDKKEKLRLKEKYGMEGTVLLNYDQKELLKKKKREKKKSKISGESIVSGLVTPGLAFNSSPIKNTQDQVSIILNSKDPSPKMASHDHQMYPINSTSVENLTLTTAEPILLSQKKSEFRDMSPELARISPLITRPPKQKPSVISGHTVPTTATAPMSIDVSNFNESIEKSASEIPPPSPWISGGTLTASSVLLPQQLNASISSTITTKEPKPIVNNEESKPACKSSYVDAEGNTVWICPACGKIDDGSPMIGCDGCDAWYHWTCVGITIAPNDNEDWFCQLCTIRKKGANSAESKKKKRKKK